MSRLHKNALYKYNLVKYTTADPKFTVKQVRNEKDTRIWIHNA